MLTPAGVLLVWLRGIISVAILVGAGWLLWEWTQRVRASRPVESPSDVTLQATGAEIRSASPPSRLRDWRPGWDETTAILAGGIALLLLSTGGRFVGLQLFRRPEADVPRMVGGEKSTVYRPDGTQISVEVFGREGPTLVATHGWGTDSREWAYLQQALANGMRVILWDLPGMGRSTRPHNDDYSLEKFANDLRAVVRLAGENRVILVGHSIGGMTTLTFCRLFPELLGSTVAGLILVHTTYRNPIRTMWGSRMLSAIEKPVIVPLLYLQIALSPLIWMLNSLSYWNGSIHWSNAFTGFGGTESRQKSDFVARYALSTSPAVLSRGCLAMLQYDVENVLPKIVIPVLVITGEQDPVTPSEANSKISCDVQAGQICRLSPAKHYGFFEHDRASGDAIAEFCRTVLHVPAVAASR